jgi:hypothetical protein
MHYIDFLNCFAALVVCLSVILALDSHSLFSKGELQQNSHREQLLILLNPIEMIFYI